MWQEKFQNLDCPWEDSNKKWMGKSSLDGVELQDLLLISPVPAIESWASYSSLIIFTYIVHL